MAMTRDEEQELIDAYIEKNGVTVLPKGRDGYPDISVWSRGGRRGRRKKKPEAKKKQKSN